jgi:hypothetical protein
VITLSWLLIITILAAALALIDGIMRVRGRGGATILAVAELVLAALMLISLFVAFPAPFGTLTWAILLEIVLVLVLIFRGAGRRGVAAITVIALILNAVVILIALGWLSIPGLG